MTRILFITWDGPQTNYLEGLFYPIFRAIGERAGIEFHVLQFTSADSMAAGRIGEVSAGYGFRYTAVSTASGLHPAAGVARALLSGGSLIARYAAENDIDILMPRSTMPALMTLGAMRKRRGMKVLFDADGLPVEERVDFAGLKKGGLMYRILKGIETRMLRKADAVITRSMRAADIHINNIGESARPKFFVVTNGRDPGFFRPDAARREEYRRRLGVAPGSTVFVYCGSIGPQYLPGEMLAIFAGYKKRHPDAKFLVLTGGRFPLEELSPAEWRKDVAVMHSPYGELPGWLDAADIAFGLRQPSYSMQGVAPIKLGEYLMMGLPTIASAGIGDTETVLGGVDGVRLYDHNDPCRVEAAVDWCDGLSARRPAISEFGVANFSVDESARRYMKAIEYVLPEAADMKAAATAGK